MVITQRDLEIFKKLGSHGMLSTQQINTLFFGGINKTTVLRRLRLLEEKHFLKRILGLESQQNLWILDTKGAEIASVEIPKRNWSKNMLEHDYKLLSLRIALEGCGVAHSWTPEHLIRSSIFKENDLRDAKKKLIPDGFMSVEFNGIKHSIAIELELTLKNKDKLRETLKRYQNKGGILGVWYIAPTYSILNSVHRQWDKSCPVKLYLSYLDKVMADPLEAELLGDGPKKKIKDVWMIQGAHSPEHGVSNQVSKSIEPKSELCC
jgi:hypothetical protein